MRLCGSKHSVEQGSGQARGTEMPSPLICVHLCPPDLQALPVCECLCPELRLRRGEAVPRPWGKQGREAASFKMVISNFIFLFCRTVKLYKMSVGKRTCSSVIKKNL